MSGLMGHNAVRGTANRTGWIAGEKEYEGPGVNDAYDNDASFDQTLNSSHADYFRNPTDNGETFASDKRWKTGGGVDTGPAKGLGAASHTRDEDGSVDRVHDINDPQILSMLYAFRCYADSYNVALEEAFEAAGGTHYGTIPASKFGSTLTNIFHRMGLTGAQVEALTAAYGIGDKAPEGSARSKSGATRFEACGWKDFIEDVEKAVDVYANQPRLPAAARQIYPRGCKY